MKRIFKNRFVVFWCCVTGCIFFATVHIDAGSQEKQEPEWVDEEELWFEEEVGSVESDTDTTETEQNNTEEQESEVESMESEMESEFEEDEEDEGDAEEEGDAEDEGDAEGKAGDLDEEFTSDKEEITTDASDSDKERESQEEAITDDLLSDQPDTEEEIPEELVDSSSDEYERNLYETYVQYYSKKISLEEWNGVSGNKDMYTIQNNDTLWDISNVLFGDPNYWPKLWSTNPSITNPHLIHPANSLGFIHGTEGAPPSLSIIQGEDTTATADEAKVLTPPLPDIVKQKKIKVSSTKKVMPVMQSIPNSLPHLYLADKKEFLISSADITFKKSDRPTVAFLDHYISDEPLDGHGIVYDKKDYGSLFHEGQRVILEMRDPVDPGQKMTVIRNKGKLHPPYVGVRGPFGYQVEVQGEVEVIGRIQDSFDLYEAKVTKSLNPVALGSVVLNKSLIQFDYWPTDVSGRAEAQIIGVPTLGLLTGYHKGIASPYSLVYLNRGSSSGFSVGQMYQIKANLGIREKEEYGYDIKVGEVKIIYAEDRFATGVITVMNNPIYVGDYIVGLDEGIVAQKGYDPLEEDLGEEDDDMVVDDALEDAFSDEEEELSTGSEDESSDEEMEDVFEAFE